MNPSTEISVVCPTYNSATFVRRTLDSVLGQTFPPLEIIISDDGSADDTATVVENTLAGSAMRWRLLRSGHHGPGAARNVGIRAAAGEWVAFIDSDDFWLPSKLEVVARAASARPDRNFFCHNAEAKRLNGSRAPLNFSGRFDPEKPLAEQLMRRNLFTPTAVVCRKQVLVQAGLFDEHLQSAQDHDLWFKLAPYVKPHLCEEILSCYVERHGNITSSNAARHLKNNLIILHRHHGKATFFTYALAIVRTFYEFGSRTVQRAIQMRVAPIAREVRRPSRALLRRRRIAEASSRLFTASIQLKRTIRAAPPVIRVLLYHDIPAVHAGNFEAQMCALARRWRFMPPSMFAAVLEGKEILHEDSLLLTFDDGFRSNYEIAQQVLNPLGIKALFFVPTDFVACRDDPVAVRNFVSERMFDRLLPIREVSDALQPMTPVQLVRLLEQGHEIGSHTLSHARLSQVDDDAVLEREIAGSARALQTLLGIRIRHFAYPFGDAASIGPRALVHASQAYDFVYSGVRGRNGFVSRYAIRRDALGPTDPIPYVEMILFGGTDLMYRVPGRRLDRMAQMVDSRRC